MLSKFSMRDMLFPLRLNELLCGDAHRVTGILIARIDETNDTASIPTRNQSYITQRRAIPMISASLLPLKPWAAR